MGEPRPSSDRFVVHVHGDRDAVARLLREAGTVEAVKGHDGLMVVHVGDASADAAKTTTPAKTKSNWNRLRKLLGANGIVQPVPPMTVGTYSFRSSHVRSCAVAKRFSAASVGGVDEAHADVARRQLIEAAGLLVRCVSRGASSMRSLDALSMYMIGCLYPSRCISHNGCGRRQG
jgi:hypothetical protein